MEILKQLFPFSYRPRQSILDLAIFLLIQVLVAALALIVIGILAKIAIIGWIFGILGGLVTLYVVAGAVLAALNYFGVI